MSIELLIGILTIFLTTLGCGIKIGRATRKKRKNKIKITVDCSNSQRLSFEIK